MMSGRIIMELMNNIAKHIIAVKIKNWRLKIEFKNR
jgi:hypothetical protein